MAVVSCESQTGGHRRHTRDKSQNRGAMGVAGNFPGLVHTRTGSKWQLMRRSSCAATGVPWVSA